MRHSSPLRILITVTGMLTITVGEAASQVGDTVILRSGHPVIGEVKSLQRGALRFDTREMDVVSIDWDDVALLTSGQFFEVRTRDGRRIFGSIQPVDTAVLVVVGGTRSDTLPFPQVIEIGPIERGFLARTNGFFDIGTNLARANRLKSLLLKARFAYRGPRWGLESNGEWYWQQQQSVGSAGDTSTQSTKRATLSLGVNRFLGARWAVNGSGQAEQNQELSLDVRFLGALGATYSIVRTQGLEFSIGAGGTINDERFTGEPRSTTGEILGTVGFDAFDVGSVDVYTNITTYINPASGGRFRMDIDGRVAWEVFSDFTVGLNVTERLDSRPAGGDAAKRDYQYSVSLGWSWS